MLVIGVLARAAHAEPLELTPPGLTPPTERPRPPAQRSLLAAYGLTVGVLAAGAIVVNLGDEDRPSSPRSVSLGIVGNLAFLAGPSVGHWYAGERITPGLVLRTAGAAAIGLMVWQHPHCADEGCGPEILAVAGILGLVGTGMAWDLLTLPRSIRRANHRAQLQLAPLITHGATGLILVGEL